MSYGQKTVALLVLGLLMLAAHPLARAAVRTWTDARGRQIQAEFVRLSGGDVVLKRPSGKVDKIPVASLSEADQTFLRALLTSQGVRVWTAIDGRQIQAKYLRVRNGNVYVNMDGVNTSFPFDRLSIADRRFVRQSAETKGQTAELPSVSDEETLPPARSWTSRDGQQAVGQFERILPDGRVLLAVDGLTRIVDVAQLSEEDHDHLREVLQPQGLSHLVPAKPEPPRVPEPEAPEPAPPEPEHPIESPPVIAPPPLPPVAPPVPTPRPTPNVRPSGPSHASPPTPYAGRDTPSASPAGAQQDFAISPGMAQVMIIVGGLMHLAGVWWIGGIALQNGNTVFGVLCFLCCGLAGMIYGFMNTEQCGAPLGLVFLGIGLQVIARVLVGF